MVTRAVWRPVRGSLLHWRLISPRGAVLGECESWHSNRQSPAYWRVRGWDTETAPNFAAGLRAVEEEYGLTAWMERGQRVAVRQA